MSKAKILILDVETAPALVYTYGLWNQNIGINQIVHDMYMLCWCAKWYGEKEVKFDSIIEHKTAFRKNPRDDSKIAKTIWKLMDEADIIIGHNGDNFDLKWLNSIFIRAGLPPVSPYKSIDTLKESRKNFKFISNKLDFLGKRLDVGKKVENEGFLLWKKCMAGDLKAWGRMKKYNIQDVKLLEAVYKEILPYIKNHPNLNTFTEGNDCPRCGGKHLTKEGFGHTAAQSYQRWRCKSCKGIIKGEVVRRNPHGGFKNAQR